jgi:crotonobetainyl-CoA:carnitine CoA-transferase CaiB-like acyl-CoA transferase
VRRSTRICADDRRRQRARDAQHRIVGSRLTIKEIRANALRLSGAGTTEYAQADGISALTAASALALGLYIRDRTGVAQDMLTTMLTSTAHALADDMVQYTGRAATTTADSELFGYNARYRLYESSDGWIYLAAPAEREWTSICAALAADVDLSGDPRFVDEMTRVAHDDELARVLASVFSSQPGQHWEQLLLAHDVGCVVVATDPPEAVLQSQDFGRCSGLLVEVEHPTFGEHDRLTPLIAMSRSDTVAEPGVLLGQHTDSILAELGYDSAAIADLRERKIVV